jgi:hypothetical protein
LGDNPTASVPRTPERPSVDRPFTGALQAVLIGLLVLTGVLLLNEFGIKLADIDWSGGDLRVPGSQRVKKPRKRKYRKHVYHIHEFTCPLCGRVNERRERIYTRRIVIDEACSSHFV